MRTPASPWRGTRDRVGGRDGLQRQVEAIHAAATQRALSRHLNLFAQLNAARSAAGTRYASAPRFDGARSYLTGKEGGRDSAGTKARQRGSRCLQGAGEKKSFCSCLKKPHHKAPCRGGRRQRAAQGRGARAQLASGRHGVRKESRIKNIRQRCTPPSGESADACQKRLKNEKRSRSLATREGRLGKENCRACSSVLQASGHYTPPLPSPRHVFCWDNTKCNLCFSIKSHVCSG